MKDKYQSYLQAVVENRTRGIQAHTIKFILHILSKIYEFITYIRISLYKSKILKQHSVGCLVISVGNLTVGGTGKTPVVEYVAQLLTKENKKTAILSRGYKGKCGDKNQVHVVCDGTKLYLNSIDSGDEPYMLAKELSNTTILIGKNRIKSAETAVSKYGCDTIILDDGYQYIKLARQLNIAVIDSTKFNQKIYLIPRGYYREPLRELKRADIVFFTKMHEEHTNIPAIYSQSINHNASIIKSTYEPVYIRDVYTKTTHDIRWLAGKKVLCISGIADPSGFEKQVYNLGADIKSIHRFKDHHYYTKKELNRIINLAISEKIDIIITTQKDAVRMPFIEKPKKLFLCYLKVKIKILEGHTELLTSLLDKIH